MEQKLKHVCEKLNEKIRTENNDDEVLFTTCLPFRVAPKITARKGCLWTTNFWSFAEERGKQEISVATFRTLSKCLLLSRPSKYQIYVNPYLGEYLSLFTVEADLSTAYSHGQSRVSGIHVDHICWREFWRWLKSWSSRINTLSWCSADMGRIVHFQLWCLEISCPWLRKLLPTFV